jgi:hypothetical protein
MSIAMLATKLVVRDLEAAEHFYLKSLSIVSSTIFSRS